MKKKNINSSVNKTAARNAGIDLLKILAVYMIVFYHSCVGIGRNIELGHSTTNFQLIVLELLCSVFRSGGNAIFFVCSAWFLLDNSYFNKKKEFYLITEVWSVSVLILAAVAVFDRSSLSASLVLKSFFPTTFANNWYITCYILFYPVHGFLNLVVEKTDKKTLFRQAFVLFVLYCCINFIKGDLFFPSVLILWVAIYFIVAYFKFYLPGFSNSRKKNFILLLICIGCQCVLILGTNFLGLKISFLSDKISHWDNNCSPFLIIGAICMFNLMKNLPFKSGFVSYVSKFSLLVYIIHENIILRNYRGAVWNLIYKNLGYSHLLLIALSFSVCLFALSMAASFIYTLIFKPWINKLSQKLYEFIKKIYLRAENRFLKLR